MRTGERPKRAAMLCQHKAQGLDAILLRHVGDMPATVGLWMARWRLMRRAEELRYEASLAIVRRRLLVRLASQVSAVQSRGIVSFEA